MFSMHDTDTLPQDGKKCQHELSLTDIYMFLRTKDSGFKFLNCSKKIFFTKKKKKKTKYV